MGRQITKLTTGQDRGRLSPCVCNTLRMVTRAVTQLYDDVLRPSSLRITQSSIVASIARAGAANPRQLGDKIAIDVAAQRRHPVAPEPGHPVAPEPGHPVAPLGRLQEDLDACERGRGGVQGREVVRGGHKAKAAMELLKK